mgnify:CR=1 FL=1
MRTVASLLLVGWLLSSQAAAPAHAGQPPKDVDAVPPVDAATRADAGEWPQPVSRAEPGMASEPAARTSRQSSAKPAEPPRTQVQSTRAAAEANAPAGDGTMPVRLALEASYRVGSTFLSPMRVDSDGRQFGQSYIAEHRFWVAPRLHVGEDLTLDSELQLASGFLGLDPPAGQLGQFGLPRDATARAFGPNQVYADQFKLRKLYLDWRTPFGALQVGRMASVWGLGILANSGDRIGDWGAPSFGPDRNYGDVVNRLLLATAPLAPVIDAQWAERLVLALAADLVTRDELTDWAAGDRGYQGLAVLRYRQGPNQAGFWIVYRDVRNQIDDFLRVWVVDGFGHLEQQIAQLKLFATGEFAVATGATSFGRNPAALERQTVQQLGGVLRAGGTYRPWHLGADVELGYASGDSNPSDPFIRNFTFDQNYNPSLVLFEELRAAETAASAARASDPENVGQAPDSVRYLPTGGGVTNAIYLRPTIRYALEDWIPGLQLRAAVLWARAEENVVDPYISTVTGGAGKNFQGGPASNRNYGVEVDVGIDYTYSFAKSLDLALSVQGGRLWPGNAFAAADGSRPDPINVGFVTAALNWLSPEELGTLARF